MRKYPDLRPRHSLPLFTLCLLVSTFPAWAQKSYELIANGGFEAIDTSGGPENWAIRNFSEHTYGSARVVTGGRFGQRCLQIEGTSYPILFGCFTLPLNFPDGPPRELLLTLFYKVKGNPVADVSVTTFADDFAAREWNTPALTTEAVALDYAPDWQAFTWHVKMVPSVRQAVVMFRIHGAGTLFVDGVSLKPSPAEVACEVLAPGLVMNARNSRQCRLKLTNRTDKALPVNVKLAASVTKGPTAQATSKATLPPGQPQTVEIAYGYPSDLPHALDLTVSGAQPDIIYDHQLCQVPGLLEGRVLKPAFRSSLLQTIPTEEIVAAGRVNAPAETYRKLKIQGKLIGTGALSQTVAPDEAGNWQLTWPNGGLLAGNYSLQIQATDGTTKLGQLDLPLAKVAGSAIETGYDERLRLVANGRPRLPMGIFYALEDKDFADAAEAGFNTLILPSRLASTASVDAATALNLSVIISSATLEDQFWQNMVSKFSANPTIMGWYVLQRPGGQVPPVHPAIMADLYGRLRAMDSRHPICLALNSESRLEPYAPWCDVIMPWTQPIPAGDLRSVDAMLQQALKVAGGQKPVWPVIQMTGAAYADDSRLDPTGNGRPPTPTEYRCMVYLALARGANGFFAYAYQIPQTKTQRDYLIQRDAPQLWEMVKQVGQQIRALTPVILEGEPVTVRYQAPAVAMRGLKYKNVTYVLVANSSNEPIPLSFTIEGVTAKELQVAFDARKLSGAGDGVFADEIEPHGVRVYMAQ